MSVVFGRIIVSVTWLLIAAPALAQVPAGSGLEGFGIVLMLGDVQEGTSDSVPAAARAALADLKDFLPYRSYRVLDTAWVLASSTTRQAVTSRLQGLDEQDYEVALDRVPAGSSLQVHFSMREPDGNAGRRAADREMVLKRQLQQLYEQLKRAEEAKNQAPTDQNQSEIDSTRRRIIEAEAVLARHRDSSYYTGSATLIDTSFTMSLGETVVVGTSRMRGGNKALIVLLTAATRGTKPRE